MTALDVADRRAQLLERLIPDPSDYCLVPLDRGRVFVVPRSQREVQRSALLDYQPMQSLKERAARRGIYALLQSPARRRLPTPAPAGHTPSMWHLIRSAVGGEVESCAAVLRPPGPHWTPILHLFDRFGRRIGVAKIAVTEQAAIGLEREAAALRALGGIHKGIIVPRLIGLERDGVAGVVAVMSPLPPSMTPAPPQVAVPGDVVLDLVEASGGPTPSPLSSAYLDELSRFVAACADLDEATRFELGRLFGEPVPVARCHGDFVPWNVGRVGSDVVLWDFEYSHADAPLGFDAVQGRYRLAREQGVDIVDALTSATWEAAPTLARLGLDSRQRLVVGALHAVDAARRIHEGVDAAGTVPARHVDAIGVARGLSEASRH